MDIEIRSRLDTAIRWSTTKSIMFVFCRYLSDLDAVLEFMTSNSWGYVLGTWDEVRRLGLANEGAPKSGLVLRPRGDEADLAQILDHAIALERPVMILATPDQREEIKRTNAWERRSFALDLTGSSEADEG